MSSLNSAATNALLMEPDVLSEPGKLSSIWGLFTKNVDFENDKNDVLKVVLNSLKSSVIDKASLNNESLDGLILEFQKMVQELSDQTEDSVLLIFLLVLADALSEYVTVNNKTSSNIQINMSESAADVSQLDEMKTLSIMERYGMVDETSLRSLLDDEMTALTTVSSDIKLRWGNGSLSGNESSDTNESPLLKLGDFVPDLEKAILNVRILIVDGADWFPKSASEMRELLGPKVDLDTSRFYHPSVYLVNCSNQKILSTTTDFLCDLFEMDTQTAIYALCSVYKKIDVLLREVGPTSSIVFSQIMVVSMLVRYFLMDGGVDASTTVQIVEELRNVLSELLHILDRESAIVDEQKNLFRDTSLVDDYVDFVGSTSEEATVQNDTEGQDFQLSDEPLSNALNELLSDLEDALRDISINQDNSPLFAGLTENAKDTLGTVSSLLETAGVEPVPTCMSQLQETYLVQCGNEFHNALNRELLDGDLESAANSIAREMAFVPNVLANFANGTQPEGALAVTLESMRRDIATYQGLLNQIPGGISKYESSAKSYVAEKLRANPT